MLQSENDTAQKTLMTMVSVPDSKKLTQHCSSDDYGVAPPLHVVPQMAQHLKTPIFTRICIRIISSLNNLRVAINLIRI